MGRQCPFPGERVSNMHDTATPSAKTRHSTRRREFALAKKALDLWLCHHAAGPDELIPYILKCMAAGRLEDGFVDALSEAASELTERRHTFGREDVEIVAYIARRRAARP